MKPEEAKSSPDKGAKKTPWYAGEHKDALFYLLVALFFVELIVGGVAFFYGIIKAAPEIPGGPPVARFPWLAWMLAALLAPVGLLLLVHLAGTVLSRGLSGADVDSEAKQEAELPPGLRRFYQTVRSAPSIVLLLGILLIGAGLFFVDGAISALGQAASALGPHIPWLAGSLAGLLAVCFLGHAFFVYRQRRLEQEYAFRREVLEKTGIVLMDKGNLALPPDALARSKLLPLEEGTPQILEIEAKGAEQTASDAADKGDRQRD